MTNEPWFIVQTNPNCERKAVSEMRRAGFRAHMPRLAKVRLHHRTKEPIMKRRPLMTGYVFMRFNGPENWYALRQCQGVKGVLYVDGHAYQMPRSDVAAIMRAQRSMVHEDGQTKGVRKELRKGRADVRQAQRKAALARFHVGMDVRTPMTGAERVVARILAITKKGNIRADMGGKLVEFSDIDNLELVDDARDAA